MVRLNVLSAVLVLYFAACLTPASADGVEYTFNGTVQGETIITGGDCVPTNVACPSAQGPPLDFSLPQFNPSLGSLQSVQLAVEAFQSGTATITNFPAIGCRPGGECHNSGGVDFNVGVAGSFSTGGSAYQLDFGGLQNLRVEFDFGEDGGTFSQGFFPTPNLLFFPPDSDPFLGTGQVNFTVGSVLEINNYAADLLNLTVDPSQLGATLDYEYDPAVPEPSLFALTGGMFGLLAVRRTSRLRS